MNLADCFQKAKAWEQKYAGRIILIVLILLFIGSTANIVPIEWMIAPSIFAVFSALNLVYESRRELQEVKDMVIVSSQHHDQLNVFLRSTLESKLLTLDMCVREMETILHSLPEGSCVDICHLGLDMTHAWAKLLELFRSLSGLKLNIKMLVISEGEGKKDDWPIEMQEWCSVANNVCVKISQSIKGLEGVFEKQGLSISLQGKRYSRYPFLHGFSVSTTKPPSRSGQFDKPTINRFFAFPDIFPCPIKTVFAEL